MNETRKWILHRVSGVILAPLYIWLYFSLISLSAKNYLEAIYFFRNPLFEILTIVIFFVESTINEKNNQTYSGAKIIALTLCKTHFCVSFI